MPAVPPLIVPDNLSIMLGTSVFSARSRRNDVVPVMACSPLDEISLPCVSVKITFAEIEKPEETLLGAATFILKYPE